MLNGHGDDLHLIEGKIRYNFSSNVYYKGCPKALLDYISKNISLIQNYPSPAASELNELAAHKFQLHSDQFLFTNGAQRLADDTLDHETPIEELFLDQLSCADLVLVSKRDLVDDENFSTITKIVTEKARPNTKIVPVVKGALDNAVLLGIQASAEDDVDNRHSIHEEHHKHGHHHHHNDDIKTVLLEYPETADIKGLVNDLKALVKKHEIYRIKGFVNIPNKPMRMVLQGVGSRFDYYFERPWGTNETRKTSIVVIGKNIELTKDNEVITHSHSHSHDHNHGHAHSH